MTDKLLVDLASGTARLVPLDPAEAAQKTVDDQQGAARAAAEAAATGNASTLRERVAQQIETLEAAAANWDTLTAAQKDSAVRLSVRMVGRLARLTVQRLDQVS